jgi:hypothetical protein
VRLNEEVLDLATGLNGHCAHELHDKTGRRPEDAALHV